MVMLPSCMTRMTMTRYLRGSAFRGAFRGAEPGALPAPGRHNALGCWSSLLESRCRAIRVLLPSHSYSGSLG